VDLSRSVQQGDPAALRAGQPSLLEAMGGAVNIMQDAITRSRLVIDPADLVLHPSLDHFALMDFHRAVEAIEQGRRHVEESAGRLTPVLARLRG
jgi:NTE family protein